MRQTPFAPPLPVQETLGVSSARIINEKVTEAARQKALGDLAILYTVPKREFDGLVYAARRTLGTRVASISQIDANR